jgi:hypothetical protein
MTDTKGNTPYSDGMQLIDPVSKDITPIESLKVEVPPKNMSSKPKRRGRPPKAVVAAKKAGNRGKVGRPKGDAAVMNEYKARMLASPKSQKVLDVILDAALNDDHKNQAAAWKLVMDRVAPVAGFERDVIKAGQGNQINISISSVPTIAIDGEVIEQEHTPGGDV